MKTKLTLIALLLSSSAFAGTTIDNIKESKTFTYGYRTSSVPYSFETKDGKAQGYSIDLGKQIHADFDAKFGVTTEMKGQPVTGSNRIPLVENGTIAMELGSTTITPDRAKKVNFMKMDVDIVTAAVLTKNSGKSWLGSLLGTGDGGKAIVSVESLKFSKAIVVAGSTGESYVKKLNNDGWGITIVSAKDYPQAFLLLQNSYGDSVITDRVLLLGEIAKLKNPEAFKALDVQMGDVEPIGLMYNKDDQEFDAFLVEEKAKFLANGTFERLYNKWFNGKAGDTNINLHTPLTEAKKKLIAAK